MGGGQKQEDRVSREGGRSAKREVRRRACRLNSSFLQEKAKGKNLSEAASLVVRLHTFDIGF